MFFILGISISVFLLFLLLIKKEKSAADRILLLWLLLLFVHQLLNYIYLLGEMYHHPHILGLDLSMPVLHGVLSYFYVLEITGQKLKKRWYVLLHLLPTLSLIIFAIPFYTLSGAEKITVFEGKGLGFEGYVLYNRIVMILSGLIYTGWNLFLIQKHRINIQHNFSNTDKKELQWLQYLSIGLGIIWFLAAFFGNTVIFSGVVVFVLFIGFFGINQLNIFNTNQEAGSEEKALEVVPKRYAKSGLSEERSTEIYTQLNQLMVSESLYKDNNITLTELAKYLKVHPNHLSQVINEKEQKNFYNYINALRVKEFIRIAALPESKKFTLLAMAYDCGFNSKSTFNKHFKENTGKTPTVYFNTQSVEK